MLKKISIILIAILLLVGLSENVLATDKYTATSTINGVTVNWEYELNDSNQVENLKCTNPTDLTGNITVPSTLDGKTVISLKNESLKGAVNITGLTIPNTLKSIGYGSFRNCANLTSVNLGQLEKISFDVFENCPKLTTITIPKTLVNGPGNLGGVFTGTTNLTSVTFENGLTQIPGGILKNCTGVTTVTIPSTVTSINECAFQNSGLTEITIPGSVKEIGFDTFKDCNKLEKITILNEDTKMGLFLTQPTKDSVFENHNENLTIYCYEDSVAAKYAIANNIKYVYLTKQSLENNTDEKQDTPAETNQQPTDNETPTTNEETTKIEDTTIAKDVLPQTGNTMTGIFVVLIILIASIIFYLKYRKFSDI